MTSGKSAGQHRSCYKQSKKKNCIFTHELECSSTFVSLIGYSMRPMMKTERIKGLGDDRYLGQISI